MKRASSLHGFRNSIKSDGVDDTCDGWLELGPVDMDKAESVPASRGLKECKPWTVDSGAAECVADPDDIPEGQLVPSPASLAGKGYVGAGKERIANLGQMRARRVTESGQLSSTLFQAAKVRKPLLAVSSTTSKGNFVAFDHEDYGGGCIIPASAPELPMIRQLIKQVADRVQLHQEKGVYLLRNWEAPGPFPGQGR